MTDSADSLVKILFRFYSEVLEKETVEILYAEPIDISMGYYRIDSIPFYKPRIATDDIVHAVYDDNEEMLAYTETLKPSGNSTVWVVIIDEVTDIDEIRYLLGELGCVSVALSDRYFSMEVKAATNYWRVRDKLNELKSRGIIDFAEPCHSENHNN